MEPAPEPDLTVFDSALLDSLVAKAGRTALAWDVFWIRLVVLVLVVTPILPVFFPSPPSALVTLLTSPSAALFRVPPCVLAFIVVFLFCRGFAGRESSSTFRAAALARVRRMVPLFSSF